MNPMQVDDVRLEREERDETIGIQLGAADQELLSLHAEWMTPGILITRLVAAMQQVRFVAERLEGPRYAVFVILDDDPEAVLDVVFEAEQEAMGQLPGMTFDLRVRKPHPGWTPDNLLRDCRLLYARNEC